MKQLLKILLTLSIILLTGSDLKAYDFKINNIAYNILSDGYSVEIAEGTAGTDINIPTTVSYNGLTYSVTSIGQHAFYRNSMESIVIPNNIVKICGYAFDYCTKLKTIEIPNSVETIENYAFIWCEELQSIFLPKNLTIISEGLFYGCSSLKTIVIPNRVTKIDKNAFAGCRSLSSIKLPESLTVIGSSAICGCNSLKTITIPKNVMQLGGLEETYQSMAISDCTSLKTVVFEDGDRPLALSGKYVSSYGSSYNYYREFVNCPIDSVYIGRNFTGLDYENIFRMTKSLRVVNFAPHVTTPIYLIETGVEKIYFGDGLTSILSCSDCPYLKEVYIGRHITEIPSYTFYKCPQLKNIYIFSDNISAVGEYAIPETINKIYCPVPSRYNRILANYYLEPLVKFDSIEEDYSGHIPSFRYINNIGKGSITFVSDNFDVNVGFHSKNVEIKFNIENWIGVADIPVTYTINKVPLTIIAHNQMRPYGQDNPILECSFFGFKNNENKDVLTKYPNIETLATRSSNVGEYPIIPSGAEAQNYSFNYERGLLTIIKADQEINWEQSFKDVQVGDIVECMAVNSSNLPVQYSSNNTNVATIAVVNNKSYVHFHSTGNVILTAQQMGNSNYNAAEPKQINITIVQEATSIELNKSSLQLNEFDTYKLTAQIFPSNATNKNINWSSSNESIATVENGVVTAINKGNAIIYASTTDGTSLIASCAVEVLKPIRDIIISKDFYEIEVDKTCQIDAYAIPTNASNNALVYESSDESVLKVDDYGLASALSEGHATVIIKSSDGTNISKEINFKVVRLISDIIIETADSEIEVGETYQLDAYAIPTNATNTTLSYKSSNEQVITVDNNGIITAISEGNASVIISTTDGTNISKRCTFRVVRYVHEIVMNPSSANMLVDETMRIDAYALPANASNTDIIFSSSDDRIVTVNDKGVVTAISEGEAIITVSACDNSGVSAQCNVTVLPKSGIHDVVGDKADLVSIYTIDGKLITKDVTLSDLPKLAPGIYIFVRYDGTYEKLLIK